MNWEMELYIRIDPFDEEINAVDCYVVRAQNYKRAGNVL